MIAKEGSIFVRKVLMKYEPFLSEDEGELLFQLPEKIPEKGVIVEIGALKGGSTILLAKGSKKAKVYSIDPHIYGTSQKFMDNIRSSGVRDFIVPVFKSSEEALKNWNKPICLLWVDGDHDYEVVKKDFLLWERHLIKGGIILFHDSHETNKKIFFNKKDHQYYKGPRRVVEEHILNSKRFNEINVVDTITYARKIKEAGILESIKYYFYKKANIDRIIGRFGIFIKKHSPKLYYYLKKLIKNH